MTSIQKIVAECSIQINSMNNWRVGLDMPTIFRAPALMRKADPDSYEPKIISFGPYHHGKPHLQATEKLKWLYLHKFLARSILVGLEECVREVKDLEKRLRSAYSEELSMESNEFTKMLLLDGCCLVELIIGIWPPPDDSNQEDHRDNDPIIGSYWMREQVIVDILMVENQLPFFLLEKLFNLIYPRSKFLPIAISIVHFFGNHLLFRSDKILENGYFVGLFDPAFESSIDTQSHLLHLFHSLLVNLKRKNNPPAAYFVSDERISHTINDMSDKLREKSNLNEDIILPIASFMKRSLTLIFVEKSFVMTGNVIPRALTLKNCGVKFEAKKDTPSFLDVSFENGVLKISQIPFWRKTNYFLRNLIAFEQCFPKVGTDLANYAKFMSSLVAKPEDVAILRKKDIVLKLGSRSERAAILINKLSDGVFVHPTKDNYLAQLCKRVNRYSEKRLSKNLAEIRNNYCGTPFKCASVFVAACFLIFAVIQTTLSILAAVKHYPK